MGGHSVWGEHGVGEHCVGSILILLLHAMFSVHNTTPCPTVLLPLRVNSRCGACILLSNIYTLIKSMFAIKGVGKILYLVINF